MTASARWTRDGIQSRHLCAPRLGVSSLQRRERRADTTGFETGDRSLTADSPDRLQGVPVDHLVEYRHGNFG
jgi:hypothetical protein